MARILIVDDELDVRNMLRDALTLRGHHVDATDKAATALDLAAATAYDIAIIDYVLPDLRGLDLLHRLHKKQPFMRSIVISGQIDHDVLDARELEKKLKDRVAADRYLPKPVSVDNLVQTISEVLEGVTGNNVDWKKVASDASATWAVRAKDLKEMNRTLNKNRKKHKP